jgi:hypothetical protein
LLPTGASFSLPPFFYLPLHSRPSLFRGVFKLCTKTNNFVIPFLFILFFPNAGESHSSLPHFISSLLLLYLPLQYFPYSYFASLYSMVKSEMLMSFHSFHILVWQFPDLSSLPIIRPLRSSLGIPSHGYSNFFFLMNFFVT